LLKKKSDNNRLRKKAVVKIHKSAGGFHMKRPASSPGSASATQRPQCASPTPPPPPQSAPKPKKAKSVATPEDHVAANAEQAAAETAARTEAERSEAAAREAARKAAGKGIHGVATARGAGGIASGPLGAGFARAICWLIVSAIAVFVVAVPRSPRAIICTLLVPPPPHPLTRPSCPYGARRVARA